MNRLKLVFSRRRRGHPAPSWRNPPDAMTPDVRLADLRSGTPNVRRPEALEVRDEEPRREPGRRIWER
ncbi:MAG: hypothetical protein ACR2GO_01875 [Candidatus Limnocylindria bacterium]